MRFEERVVTPEDAKKWLKNQAEENRDISDSVVTNYAMQMKEGWWTESSEPVAFRSGDDKLIDGQHRLSAIIRADVNIKMGIIWDAPPTSFKNLNSGYSRSVSFRTHTPSFATQCYGLLLNMTRGSSRLVASEVELMHGLLAGYAERLKASTSGKIAFFSSAPIRSAALVSLALGEKSDYILKTYSLLSTGNPNGISLVGNAFMTAFHRNTLIPKGSRGGLYSRELYFRARYVFDFKNAEIDNLPRDYKRTFDNYQYEVRSIIERALGKHFSPLVTSKVRSVQRKLEKVVHKESTNTKLTKQLARVLEAEQIRLSQMARD